jgi:hypothetical protein
MSGDAHVRICESLGVKFPRATRLYLKIAVAWPICGEPLTPNERYLTC